VTAAVAGNDLSLLRDLVAWWREDRLRAAFRAPADLSGVLDQIGDRRARGGDVLQAEVRGDSVPEMHAAALAKAAELWGPAAQFEVRSTDTVFTTDRPGYPAFRAYVYVRCVNYAEVAK
jgi:hypothetical protein